MTAPPINLLATGPTPDVQPGGRQRATPLQETAPRLAPDPVISPLREPPPPIEKVRGKAYPTPEAPDDEKTEYLKTCLRKTEPEALARNRTQAYHLLMANGKQHIGWSDRSRTYEDLPLEPNEQRVVYNLIRPILRARVQRLLPDRLDWQVIPDSNDYDARDSAKVAERWLDAKTRDVQLTTKTDKALELAFSGGVSFLKSFWNPSIGPATAAQVMVVEPQDEEVPGPDGMPMVVSIPTPKLVYVNADGVPVESVEEAYVYRPGDVDVAIRSLFNIRWNPDAMGFTAGEGLRWILDRDAVPLEAAKERWPEYAEKIKATGDASAILTYERMAQQSTLKQPGRTSTGASGRRAQSGDQQWTTVVEYWELPSEYFPQGRLIVMVGDCIVDDREWPDGVLPYTPIYDEPVPLSPAGRGIVQDMVGLQAVMNELMATLVMANRFRGFGQWVTVKAPGVPDNISGQHGAILQIPPHVLRGRPLNQMFVPLVHPQLPGDLYPLIQQVQNAMYSIGAFHEITRGQVPPGVTSGVAVRALSEREDGQLKRSQKALRESMIQWARTALQIAVRNYAEGDERWIPVDRPDMGYEVEGVAGEKLPDPERILIELNGFKARTEEELRADVKEGMMNGWITPGQGLKALDFGRGIESAFASEQRHMAKARRENQGIENGEVVAEPILDENGQQVFDVDTGEPVPPVVKWAGNGEPLTLDDIDEHLLHMNVLEDLILDYTKPDNVRQMAYLHWQEHYRAMQVTLIPPSDPESDNASPTPPDGGAPQ